MLGYLIVVFCSAFLFGVQIYKSGAKIQRDKKLMEMDRD